VLLSGGIGSGKSTVGELLRARGALVVDADAIGHQVLEPGGEAFTAVAEAWPSVVVEGIIDRSRLAEIVFSDPTELDRLESMTHSAIRRRISEVIAGSTQEVVVVEVPLLTDFMGPGWVRVVVDADVDVRLERLRRRGVDRDDALRRMNVQPDRQVWRTSADFVVDNAADYAALGAQVDALWAWLSDRYLGRTAL
jgi:dephospho-CoA kinase